MVHLEPCTTVDVLQIRALASQKSTEWNWINPRRIGAECQFCLADAVNADLERL